jgi:hypothetical protein
VRVSKAAVYALLLGFVAGLAACACGGGNAGGSAVPDAGQTPAYANFLQRLGEQRTLVRFLGARTVQGHWSTADTVAASGCQCATTWAALYVEHRLSLNGHAVLVDEELIPGASGIDVAATPAASGAPHVFRRQNLVATTSTSDKKTLALLQQLFSADAAGSVAYDRRPG